MILLLQHLSLIFFQFVTTIEKKSKKGAAEEVSSKFDLTTEVREGKTLLSCSKLPWKESYVLMVNAYLKKEEGAASTCQKLITELEEKAAQHKATPTTAPD